MDISTTENLKTVRDSNQEILDYFNELYVENLEQIQTLKTEQFELKILSEVQDYTEMLKLYQRTWEDSAEKPENGQIMFQNSGYYNRKTKTKRNRTPHNIENMNIID